MIATLGAKAVQDVVDAGRFGRFAWRSVTTSLRSCCARQTYPLIWTQMNIIGVRSVPVIMITGAFVGMTLAVQAYDQLAGMGLEEHLGVLINISVVKELGPVLAAVMLAGRVGGALTAELGTMNVTEQIDAVRSMGTDPIRYLVAPRLLACLLLTPILIMYADAMGVIGGALVSFLQLGINSRAYWNFSASGVELWEWRSASSKASSSAAPWPRSVATRDSTAKKARTAWARPVPTPSWPVSSRFWPWISPWRWCSRAST